MSVHEVIDKIEKAAFGGFTLDEAIGFAVGWQPQVEYLKEHGSSTMKRNVVWLVPNGKASKLPPFSTSLDAAVSLLDTVAPDEFWGVTFQNGRAKAVVGENSYSEAATAELAVCAAVLRFMQCRRSA
ncbi:hypothetical protein BMJ25_17425 [Sinorhizobium medicae]|nr:hypothetical protein BMJ25_17425 [Sinorhizobium medicae]